MFNVRDRDGVGINSEAVHIHAFRSRKSSHDGVKVYDLENTLRPAVSHNIARILFLDSVRDTAHACSQKYNGAHICFEKLRCGGRWSETNGSVRGRNIECSEPSYLQVSQRGRYIPAT